MRHLPNGYSDCLAVSGECYLFCVGHESSLGWLRDRAQGHAGPGGTAGLSGINRIRENNSCIELVCRSTSSMYTVRE